jgi:hypothetical protein
MNSLNIDDFDLLKHIINQNNGKIINVMSQFDVGVLTACSYVIYELLNNIKELLDYYKSNNITKFCETYNQCLINGSINRNIYMINNEGDDPNEEIFKNLYDNIFNEINNTGPFKSVFNISDMINGSDVLNVLINDIHKLEQLSKKNSEYYMIIRRESFTFVAIFIYGNILIFDPHYSTVGIINTNDFINQYLTLNGLVYGEYLYGYGKCIPDKLIYINNNIKNNCDDILEI